MTLELRRHIESTLGPAYRLSRELGGASMSRVFVAHDEALGRRVVVKVLPPELAIGVNLERFRREIEVAAQLHHPNIVPVLEADQATDIVYFTMPFIEGETLRTIIDREKQLAIADAIAWTIDVAAALAYAHASNIVHRDIKPQNILVDNGRAMVTDFGIARAIERAADIDSVTSTGLTLGTPTYMSPEQAAAEKHIDGRSDIYSLGCVLFEMLAGQPPFTGASARVVVMRHLNERPRPIREYRPDASAALERVVDRALAKSPGDRFATAASFADALRKVTPA